MNNKRLKIGVDIDGVLIDTDSHAYLKFCEQEFGWDIRYDVFEQTHSWHDATGQSEPAIMGQAFEQFLASVEESQKPIEGAHDALREIGKVADIYLITARVGTLLRVTEDFLRAHLQDVRYTEISMGNLDNKAQRIVDFGVDLYIDDSYREISMILKDEAVTATIIPFPAFHGLPRWDTINDERIHWLPVWQDLKEKVGAEQHPIIRQQAWQEIAHFIKTQKNSQGAQ